jgi:hypothetical protein
MKFNCDDVTERLPWLLNGTLGDEERAAVREHLAECASCRRALAETRLAWETFDQHPPTEEIVALAWGETPNPTLEEHLESCPRCTAELELARMSRHLEEDEKIVPLPARRTEPATAPAMTGGRRGWRNAALAASLAGVVGLTGWMQSAQRVQTLEEQIAARPAPPVATVPGPSPTPPIGTGEPAVSPEETERAAQLAAELETRTREVEAMRGQLEDLNGRLDQIASARPAAPQPQAIDWVRDLRPSGDVVRGGTGEGALEVPARESAILFLGAAHRETHNDGHAIEITDASGKVIWSQNGVVRDSGAGTYTLALPPGSLRGGDYTIRVYGLNGGQREPVETYAIRVRG